MKVERRVNVSAKILSAQQLLTNTIFSWRKILADLATVCKSPPKFSHPNIFINALKDNRATVFAMVSHIFTETLVCRNFMLYSISYCTKP